MPARSRRPTEESIGEVRSRRRRRRTARGRSGARARMQAAFRPVTRSDSCRSPRRGGSAGGRCRPPSSRRSPTFRLHPARANASRRPSGDQAGFAYAPDRVTRRRPLPSIRTVSIQPRPRRSWRTNTTRRPSRETFGWSTAGAPGRGASTRRTFPPRRGTTYSPRSNPTKTTLPVAETLGERPFAITTPRPSLSPCTDTRRISDAHPSQGSRAKTIEPASPAHDGAIGAPSPVESSTSSTSFRSETPTV